MTDQLVAIGLLPADGSTYRYKSPQGYAITLFLDSDNPNASRIDYGPSIKVHHKGSSSLEKAENLVVLECVIRLLNKGYLPEHIELEKVWKLGHAGKGRLDILFRNPKGQVHAMIECKTWGEEYYSEKNKMLEDGGQLFSYLIQERKTKELYIYTSKVENGQVLFHTEFVDAAKLTGSNQEEIFASWDKTFFEGGLFENKAALYGLERHNILRRELKDLDKDTGKAVFNSFAEILRRNVISDKANAFNKIFNLFVCKIADEDLPGPDEETWFQWRKTGDSAAGLLERLRKLYIDGLRQYLGIDVQPDYFSALGEFAFVDIYDQASFDRNAQVLKEVVELLQGFRVKYSSKHQFLGDFFEMLLNTGLKQESGQFFTPVPLARFILRSIPLRAIIQDKIDRHQVNVLPYLLDFACGAGHFLTEAIEEIQPMVDAIPLDKLTGQARNQITAQRHGYLWAKEYIYGIEKDYRLAKATKIATFLNGDGEAKIINGDGLDDFHDSPTYKGILKTESSSVENPRFDVVVSNPPFAIDSFKKYVPNGSTNFVLYDHLTTDSTEIETLFLERTWQVLTEGGVAGIIMPLSILNSKKDIYTAARKLLLLGFEIVALVEMREKTFIATPTTTVCLFLRKRAKSEVTALFEKLRAQVLSETSTCIEPALKAFAEQYPDEAAALPDLLSKTALSSSPAQLDQELVFALSFLLNYGEQTLVAFSGEKQEQESFLGYKFSSGRGREGIHLVRDDTGKFRSLLWDEEDPDNTNVISTHIRARFLKEDLPVPENLSRHLSSVDTNLMVSASGLVIDNPSAYLTAAIEPVSYSPFSDFIDEIPTKAILLRDLIDSGAVKYLTGATFDQKDMVPYPTDKKILTASNIDLNSGKLVFEKFKYVRSGVELSESLKPRAGDIVMAIANGSLRHLGKVAFVREPVDAFIGGFLSIIRCDDLRIAKAVHYNLLSLRFRKYVTELKGQNISNLTQEKVSGFRLLIPDDLDAFYADCCAKEAELDKARQAMAKFRSPGSR